MSTAGYDPIKKAIRDAIFTSVPVYPSHISTITDPVFPCITITRNSGGTERHWIGKEAKYQIDVWTKTGNDELWALYNAIEARLNLKVIPGITFLIKEENVDDDLFEADTRTWHLAAVYRVMFENNG